MASDGDEARWSAEADAVWAEIRAWRTAHPTATWVEIQRAVDERMRSLRERVLTDTAQASAVADFAGSAQRPVCPHCGGVLQADGRKARTVLAEQGATISLSRTYGWCPRCRAGLFPPG
jgi:ribosomal protein S27AE